MRLPAVAAAGLALATVLRAASAADMAAAQALMGWLQANGADVSKVGLADLPGLGLSMLATAPVPPSEPACMIPLNLTMSYATAVEKPVIGPVVRALYDGTLVRLMGEAGDAAGDSWIVAANLDRDTERIYGALLLLHYEAFINTARSRWGPYIASLPHGFPTLPRYYAASAVGDVAADDMVRSTPWLNELAAAKHTQAAGMAAFLVSIMRRFPTVFGDIVGDEALRGRRLREARWCYDVSETRAFGARFAGDVHALYPLLDISNHDARYPSALPVLRPPQAQAAADGSSGSGVTAAGAGGGFTLAQQFVGVSIINGEKRPLVEGEQVWSSYHARGTDGACNARLLSQYGFVDGNEASDCVRLLLSFPAIDTWATKPDELTRRAMLGALGIIAPPEALPNGTRPAGSPTVFDAHTLNTVAVRGEAIPPVLLRTLRVNNVPAQLLSRALTEGWTATGMLTLDTELAAYQQLLGMLAAVRAEYEGVLEAWRGKGYVVGIPGARDGAGKEAVQPAPGTGPAVSNVLHVHLGAMRALDALRDQLVAQWNAFITQQLAAAATAAAAPAPAPAGGQA